MFAYPSMTGGSVAFCAAALAHGWPVWLIAIVVFGASMPLVVLLERLIPYSARLAEPVGDERTDVWHFFVSNRGFDVGTFIAVVSLAPLGVWVSARFGLCLWPASWPVLAQAALALALYELPWYAIHRLEHTSPLWFRLHAAHHSARRREVHVTTRRSEADESAA